MRHNRGRKKFNNNQNLNSNQNILLQNKFNTPKSMDRAPIALRNQNYAYIGRCRCGYGPNAFYRSPDGNIIHANQLTQVSQINSAIQKNPSSPTPLRRTIPPQIEQYRICKRCGSQVREDAYFCTECGNELIDSPFLSKKGQIDLLKEKIQNLKNQLKVLKKKNK